MTRMRMRDDYCLDALRGTCANPRRNTATSSRRSWTTRSMPMYVGCKGIGSSTAISRLTVYKGEITFRVKWEGYEKKADQTWEPEDGLLYVPHPAMPSCAGANRNLQQ